MSIVPPTVVIRTIRDAIRERGTQAEFAKQWGVSGAYISAVLRGKKEPSDRLLRHFGFRRVSRYERVESDNDC